VAAAEIMVREGLTAQEAIRSAHAASEAFAEMTTAEPASMTNAEPASAMSSASAAASRKNGARCGCHS
jgi:hypothetical protein